MTKSPKRGGFDWEVFILYLDGEDDSLTVSNCWTVEDAVTEGRAQLSAYNKDDDEQNAFEIVAVIRADAEI